MHLTVRRHDISCGEVYFSAGGLYSLFQDVLRRSPLELVAELSLETEFDGFLLKK